MAKFWDKLLDSRFSFNTEISILEKLMHSLHVYGELSLYEIVADNFLSWKYRQNFIDLESCMAKTGIKAIITKSESSAEVRGAQAARILADRFNSPNKKTELDTESVDCTVDDYFDYIEFILNVLPIAVNSNSLHGDLGQYNYIIIDSPESIDYEQIESTGAVAVVLKNIFNTTEKASSKIVFIEGAYRVIMKDPMVLDVATRISETKPALVDDILFYRHRENKGNLKEKGAILVRLYIHYESIKQLLSGYTTFASDIRFIANEVPEIRHYCQSKEAEIFRGMPADEKEEWYDKLFTLFLGSIQLSEHNAINKKINVIKIAANAGATK